MSTPVDQLASSAPRIKPKATRHFSSMSILSAQIFTNYSSTPSFLGCYLIETFSGEEAIKVKVSFEYTTATHSICILHCRACDGRFAYEAFSMLTLLVIK